MIVVWLFLAVPWVCVQFVIVVFSDHVRLLFFTFSIFKAMSNLIKMHLFRKTLKNLIFLRQLKQKSLIYFII